jgi:hypothetical protein
MKFHQNPSSGSPVVPCGQTDKRTDGHDEANSHFLQFCERAYKTICTCMIYCNILSASNFIYKFQVISWYKLRHKSMQFYVFSTSASKQCKRSSIQHPQSLCRKLPRKGICLTSLSFKECSISPLSERLQQTKGNPVNILTAWTLNPVEVRDRQNRGRSKKSKTRNKCRVQPLFSQQQKKSDRFDSPLTDTVQLSVLNQSNNSSLFIHCSVFWVWCFDKGLQITDASVTGAN